MDSSEAKKLAETVEAGLRDGRTLESLRKAMKGSGYTEDDIRMVLANVDRKRTGRKPPVKKSPYKGWMTTAIALAIVILLGITLINRPAPEKGNGGQNVSVSMPGSQNGTRTCYVLNETVKELMIQAGAKCDKWYLIRDITAET